MVTTARTGGIEAELSEVKVVNFRQSCNRFHSLTAFLGFCLPAERAALANSNVALADEEALHGATSGVMRGETTTYAASRQCADADGRSRPIEPSDEDCVERRGSRTEDDDDYENA
jgi:hypothetical protein